jgi:methylase of polypeptide subunit release factors
MTEPTRAFCCEEDLARIGYDGLTAEEDLAAWLEYGARETTQELIDALVDEGVAGQEVTGAAVLDIGAGVGMVHVALLEAGAARAVDVDASRDYLDTARQEAERRGLLERIEYRHGDVVALAADGGLPEADIVTADAVICCYPYLPEFVEAAASVHPRLIGLTWPSDALWSRAEMHLLNAWWRLTRQPDRWFVHRRGDVDELLRRAGFEEAYWGGTRGWKVAVYRRVV